jgi:hypothetical protein
MGGMSIYLAQIEEVVRVVKFHSPTVYSWFGKPSPRVSASIERELTPRTARNYLLYNLQAQLYNDFYCRGKATPSRAYEVGSRAGGSAPFVERLSRANSGGGYWEWGWQAKSVDAGGRVSVSKGGLEIAARRKDCKVLDGEVISPGIGVGIRYPKELPDISPGFYMALGDRDTGGEESTSLVRLYWNLTAEGAVLLVEKATRALNGAHIPFRLKVINDPASYIRCDAAVLYIRKSDYGVARPLLQRIYSQVGARLGPGVPALTRRLAPGLGLAEDPEHGESFGMHRCMLLAQGLLRAHESGEQSVQGRLEHVVGRFTEEGISLVTPYLRAGSTDDYSFEPTLKRTSPARKRSDPEDFLSVAHGIGSRLAREAIWHEGVCNWVGAAPQQGTGTTLESATFQALGPDLYWGTAGVALYLAELWAQTGDGELRRVALGAIRQALNRAESVPLADRIGLYTGWLGIVLASVRIALHFGEDEPLSGGLGLLKRLRDDISGGGVEHRHDLLDGRAGAIVTLLVLSDTLNDKSLSYIAAQMGDELIEAADKSKVGYSWRARPTNGGPNLTGFAHGTAGIAYALLMLYEACGDSRYRHAGERAFAYELHWFDPAVGGWPDLRTATTRVRKGGQFPTYWCHGAGGIALSRLYAHKVLSGSAYREEALAGLRATGESALAGLPEGSADFSLCHGLAGKGDVLLCGYHSLGEEAAWARQIALDIAHSGIEWAHAGNGRWHCGCGPGSGETQGLMLGLAGIGLFYLRLHNPSVPTPLMLRQDTCSPRLPDIQPPHPPNVLLPGVTSTRSID